MTTKLTITQPDDWHIHLRDGEALKLTVDDASKQFARAIVMPNLVPPVTTADQALAYRARIEQNIPAGREFSPLMVLYLTDNTTAEMIKTAKQAGVIACKLYPAGATTNSDSGVTDIKHIHAALNAMQEESMLLLVHGEVTDNHIDIFDREKAFIDTKLQQIRIDFPELKVVLEHITTADAVEFVMAQSENCAATITAHHLLYNRNHMLVGGIRPHYYCLPILKRSRHQEALLKTATSGDARFFLGTDSAPHATDKKENACGCAGCYSAFAAIELYAQAFDQENALDKLEAFASFHGPDYYGLPRNSGTITLTKEAWTVSEHLQLSQNQTITPLAAGQLLDWKLQAN